MLDNLESSMFMVSEVVSLGKGVCFTWALTGSMGVGIWVDNGVFPGLNGLPLSQTKGLLDEVIDDGLIAVFAECGLRAFFQACLDDALLDLDEDDEAGGRYSGHWGLHERWKVFILHGAMDELKIQGKQFDWTWNAKKSTKKIVFSSKLHSKGPPTTGPGMLFDSNLKTWDNGPGRI